MGTDIRITTDRTFISVSAADMVIAAGTTADMPAAGSVGVVDSTVAGMEVATGVIDSAAGSNAQPVRLSLTGALSFWAVQ